MGVLILDSVAHALYSHTQKIVQTLNEILRYHGHGDDEDNKVEFSVTRDNGVLIHRKGSLMRDYSPSTYRLCVDLDSTLFLGWGAFVEVYAVDDAPGESRRLAVISVKMKNDLSGPIFDEDFDLAVVKAIFPS